MTTTRGIIPILCLLLCFSVLAQPDFSKTRCNLIGIKQIGNALLLIEKAKASNTIKLTLLDSGVQKSWTKELRIPRPYGYNFNQMQVKYNSTSIYVISQLTKYTEITRLNRQTGAIENNFKDENLQSRDMLHWVANESGLFLAETKEGEAYVAPIVDSQVGESKLINQIDSTHFAFTHSVYATKNDNVIFGSYSLEQNHGEMHLSLTKYNTTTGDMTTVNRDLTMDYTSFTFNNEFDQKVVGVIQGKDAFYLVGKLDLAFKNKYPTSKVGENFIGFWVVKFSYDLEMEYFSEVPFQYFEGIIPADMIKKAAIIDIKEDEQGGIFVVLNELQGMIYGNKYIVYMDRYGIHKTITGGQDAYHFFEYDKQGLHNSGHRNKIRLMKDDWSPVGTNIFPYLDYAPAEYSATTNKVIKKSQERKVVNEKKIYTFFHRSDGTEVILEYLKKKRGTLHIYLH